MKKIIFVFLVCLTIFAFFLPKKSPVSAAFGYDLQITSFYACYNSASTTSEGFTNGNYRFTIGVRNNGPFVSPASPTGVILFVNDYIGYFGYPTAYTFALGSIDPNSSISVYETKTMTTWGFDYVTTDINDDNPANDALYFIKDSGPCPAAPTPTPTPTPVSCPLGLQQTSFSGSGTPLINDYNTTQYKGSPQYTLFTANKNGKVSKVEIYGTLDRDVAKSNKVLQCKITNSTGSVNLGESTTNNGPFTKGVSWMKADFTTPVSVISGNNYRLYCKVNNLAGGSYIYWLDFWNNRTDKTRKIYLCQ